jgi:hypothetical protein
MKPKGPLLCSENPVLVAIMSQLNPVTSSHSISFITILIPTTLSQGRLDYLKSCIFYYNSLFFTSITSSFVSENYMFQCYRTIIRFVTHKSLHFSCKYIALTLIKIVVKIFLKSSSYCRNFFSLSIKIFIPFQ